jgi:hypothetical protein
MFGRELLLNIGDIALQQADLILLFADDGCTFVKRQLERIDLRLHERQRVHQQIAIIDGNEFRNDKTDVAGDRVLDLHYAIGAYDLLCCQPLPAAA